MSRDTYLITGTTNTIKDMIVAMAMIMIMIMIMMSMTATTSVDTARPIRW
jgi:hypothetical protein